jgi:hypothetical protein
MPKGGRAIRRPTSYEITALVTFWVDTNSEARAREMVDNLEGESVADKIEVTAIQISTVDMAER